jgi:hypothetical protein
LRHTHSAAGSGIAWIRRAIGSLRARRGSPGCCRSESVFRGCSR